MKCFCFLSSSVGRKVIMALTGVVLVGFTVAHMLGNLQLFMGPEALNGYGEFLHHMLHGGGIWIARLVLLSSVALHIWAAVTLTREARLARPDRYQVQTFRKSTYASRTMIFSGPILALFIIYHLLHLTIGSVHPSFQPGDVYHNVTAGYRVLPVSAFYIAAMLSLGFHMHHGIWSMLQTLGVSHPRWNPLRFALASGITAIVVLGNISMPVAVLAGWVR